MPDQTPPYMNAYGNVTKILNAIKQAQTPPRFTTDYLETSLGFSGGGARPFIPLAKRLGLIASDGTPTELYRRFRNHEHGGQALAEAMRKGYPTLFARNEYADRLDSKKLEGLVIEVTGLDSKAPTLNTIVKTFEALKALAEFTAQGDSVNKSPTVEEDQPAHDIFDESKRQLQFSYTIYLNLPNTTDIAVFNAIFKSLRENLLK